MSDTPVYRVIRILEYVGPLTWLESTMAHSFADQTGKCVGPHRSIREVVRTSAELWIEAETVEHDSAMQCANADNVFVCTRTKGHSGDHVAHDTEGQQVYRWPS